MKKEPSPNIKADLEFLSTSFYVIYGVSKFISGALFRFNPRYVMAFGLIATGIYISLSVPVRATDDSFIE